MINEVQKYYDLNSPSKKGPRGFLFAYDEKGNLLFTRENMIVETGRKQMMLHGFDAEGRDSKITTVILGNSVEMTEPGDTIRMTEPIDLSVMGNHTILIEDRIKDDVIIKYSGSADNTEDLEYVTEAQYNKYIGIINNAEPSSNIENFADLTIDRHTGNICGKTSGDVIINSVKGATADQITEVNGYDNSCFDIYHDELCALVKIFVRRTYDDNDLDNNTYESGNPNISQEKISSLALVMTNGELFSRVVFPPYYKSSTQSIVFNYYIYF